MLDSTVADRTQAFLDEFGKALEEGDIDAAREMFLEDCYWRDLVTFTWNLKTVEGKDEVEDMLRHQLDTTKPRNWQLAEGEIPSEEDGVTTAWIEFETDLARGYGLLRLKDGKIWTLLTTMVELKGFEEAKGFDRPLGAKHGAGKNRQSWAEEREREAQELGYKTQPYVLVIGGGQGGIALGARLRQLGVPAIIVEKNDRPGDSWRKRYKSLCLHDPVWYDHLPYIKFPENWPVFAPKDKIGDWLEMYTKVMELNYWTRTTAKSAEYDEAAQEWTVVLDRDGEEVILSPSTSSWRRACPARSGCRSSPAWTPSRASSTIPRSIPDRTTTPARRWWSWDRTTPPTTSAPRSGSTMPTSRWCSGPRPTSSARTA